MTERKRGGLDYTARAFPGARDPDGPAPDMEEKLAKMGLLEGAATIEVRASNIRADASAERKPASKGRATLEYTPRAFPGARVPDGLAPGHEARLIEKGWHSQQKPVRPSRALSISALLLAVGYALLTSAAPWALWLSLGFLVLGGALFKPSTQAMITLVFPEGDSRLEAAQVRFYIAANAGAAIGSILSGLAVRYGGWVAAFVMAAAVMLAASVLLAIYRHSLPPGDPSRSRKASPEAASLSPRRRAILIGALMLAMLLYVLCYAQVEGSLVLWAQNRTERMVHGFEVPAAAGVAFLAILPLGGALLIYLITARRRPQRPTGGN